LTKVFSGDSNVMGGRWVPIVLFAMHLLTVISLVLNPKGSYYPLLKEKLKATYEDNFWGEDTLFLERNSRDFLSRVERINVNAEAVCVLLLKHPKSTYHSVLPITYLRQPYRSS
jgi:cystathionine gamma-synthase